MNHFSGRNYVISSTLTESIIRTLVGDARWLEWHWSHRGRMYDAEFSPIHNLGIITHPLWGPHPSCVLFTCHLYVVWCCVYDAVSDLMHNCVAQTPDFKSTLIVVKMVLNTQCYQHLWLTMWFHTKESKETLKKPKSLILQCKFGSRDQKWPKTTKKRITQSRFTQFFV